MNYDNKYIQDYINIVRSQEFPQCREQLLLCDFIEKILKGDDIYIDEQQLEKYLAYEKYFPYKLFPWEKFLFTLHNCTYYKETNQLRFPELFVYVGRGSGKNGFESFEDFCLLTPINGVKEYNIDIFANNEDQAKTSFNDVWNILEDNSEKMKKHFHWNREIITNLKTRSNLKFHTSNARTKDGGRPGKVTFDEVHAYENYDVIQVAKTGLGKKAYPRISILSTDGDVRDGVLDHYKERSLNILNGNAEDNGFLPFMCRLDNIKEVDNPLMWHKANPSLRYLPNLMSQMKMEYQDYLMDRVSNSQFVTKRMNLPQGFADTQVATWEDIKATNQDMYKFDGLSCIVGIDYASTTDFVGCGFLFWKDNKFQWVTHSWVCTNSKDLSRIKAPLKEWEKDGLLTFVDDVEINPDTVVSWIKSTQLKHRLKIKKVCIDKFRFTLMSKALSDAGFNFKTTIKLVRPSDEMMIIPVITSNFVNKNIIFGDNPLMRWYTNNSKIERVGINNIYSKIEPKSRKTDGFKAFVGAMTECSLITKTYSSIDFKVYTY